MAEEADSKDDIIDVGLQIQYKKNIKNSRVVDVDVDVDVVDWIGTVLDR